MIRGDEKVEDWKRLKKLTIEKGYFDIPSKSDSEVDQALCNYHQTYGEPFNLSTYRYDLFEGWVENV